MAEQRLLDALWPDLEGDAAHNSLHQTLVRLRRLLGDSNLLHEQGSKLVLDQRKCWVDAWEFERRLAQRAVNDRADPEDISALARTLSLYGGAFSVGEVAEPWAVEPRERLRGKFVHALAGLCDRLENAGREREALDWYLKGVDADPVVDRFHQGVLALSG